jgi:hypothetical protein
MRKEVKETDAFFGAPSELRKMGEESTKKV